MLPQNGQHLQRPAQQMQGFPPQAGAGFDGAPFFNLDPNQAAKQMAALNAANHARMASNSRIPSSSAGGTSSAAYVGGINPSGNYPPQNQDLLSSSPSAHAGFQLPNNHGLSPMPNSAMKPSLLEPSMSSSVTHAREQGFLNGLHNLHAKRNTPLPPFLTGVTVPNYDHATSRWSSLEPGSEVGTLKLAGKDFNLFKLWGLVFANGGGEAVNNNNGWSQFASALGLPEEYPAPNGNNSVAAMLASYYKAIIAPFEESYKQNMLDQQKKANAAARQGGMMPNMPLGGGPAGPGMLQQQQQMNANPMALQRMGSMNQGMPGSQNQAQLANGLPRLPMNQQPNVRPQSGMGVSPGGDMLPAGSISDVSLLDQDVQGIKRKLDPAEMDNKRVRPRTDGQDASSLSVGMLDRQSSEPQVPNAQVTQGSPSNAVRPRQAARRKIEYVPFAREVPTYGGRDLNALEQEYISSAGSKRAMRTIGDWGAVDVDHLTLSIRSRLSTELSYALTTFTMFSTMKGHQEGTGFPLHSCLDLLDEILDLAEDLAFDAPEPPFDDSTPSTSFTHRQLVSAVLDEQHQPFAGLERHQGSKDPDIGPMQRPAAYILAVVNIIRNLSYFNSNLEVLARNDRLVNILLRLGTVTVKNGSPVPASPALSLSDVVTIRKDTLHTLASIANLIILPTTPPPSIISFIRRIIDLVSSYLVDPEEAVSPLASVQQIGVPVSGFVPPPPLADMALEVLVRFTFPDHNRQAVAKAVPHDVLQGLIGGLVHRMPIHDADFHLLMQIEQWMSYSTQLIMAVYILVFLAPTDLKQRIRSDRRLGLKSVLTRLLNRFLVNPEARSRFMNTARRVTETLKVLDDALDPFENPVDSLAPALSFGMGFSDSKDNGQEKGTGLLGAHRDLGWEALMTREVQVDEIMFRELESLVRIECQ